MAGAVEPVGHGVGGPFVGVVVGVGVAVGGGVFVGGVGVGTGVAVWTGGVGDGELTFPYSSITKL